MNKKILDAATAIMTKHGITYADLAFKKPKKFTERLEFWQDKVSLFYFFDEAESLLGCCGVIEMSGCAAPSTRSIRGVTSEEWLVLFQFNVHKILEITNRRLALVTLIHPQRRFIPYLKVAGFKQVAKGFNPGTKNWVTIWVLSI